MRKAHSTQLARLRLAQRYIIKAQARGRGVLARRAIKEMRSERSDLTPWVVALQSQARGIFARRALRARKDRLRALVRFIVKVQAQSRGVIQRRRYAKLKAEYNLHGEVEVRNALARNCFVLSRWLTKIKPKTDRTFEDDERSVIL